MDEGVPLRGPDDRHAMGRGDWEQLLATHLDAVYAYILRRVGNRADAEDLTHDVFLRAWRWLDLGRSEAEVGSWLVRAARTVIARQTAEALADHEPPVLAARIGQRVAFADAAQSGRLVAELDEASIAAREIAAFAREVEGLGR